MMSPSASAAARASTLRSSRTLPGHGLRLQVLERVALDDEIAAWRDVLEELLAEHGHVLGAIAQRREAQPDLREAEEEVLAEVSRVDLVAEIAVRRGDDAHVDLHRGVVTDAHDLVTLEHAQELRLERHRQLADLVDEDGAAGRRLEEARAPLGRAR